MPSADRDEEMRVLRGEQEVDENNLRLPDLDEEDDDDDDDDDLGGDDFGDQDRGGGGGMQTTMRRPGGPSTDGGRRVSGSMWDCGLWGCRVAGKAAEALSRALSR